MHIPFWDVRIPRGSILLFFGTKKKNPKYNPHERTIATHAEIKK